MENGVENRKNLISEGAAGEPKIQSLTLLMPCFTKKAKGKAPEAAVDESITSTCTIDFEALTFSDVTV